MRVILREAAYADLERIFAWIAKDDLQAASRIVAEIFGTIERLEIVPEIGRHGRVRDTREWAVRGRPYIVVYAVDRERHLTVILGVVHTARDR
jgi:plasmid stabilization system protein ParE